MSIAVNGPDRIRSNDVLSNRFRCNFVVLHETDDVKDGDDG